LSCKKYRIFKRVSFKYSDEKAMEPSRSKLCAAVVLMCLILAEKCPAQITNYWTQQYGTRSNLLGGAVIGSVSDMSATYYNPGAIALFKDASLLLSAQVYEYGAIKLEGGADAGRALKTSSIRPSADLLAGG
jgi:hypothetical protein